MAYTVKREIIEKVRVEEKTMRKLTDWLDVEFESSSGKTPEFMAFASMFKSHIRREVSKRGLNIVNWSNGHFYCSAFVLNPATGKLAYMSISDVRYFKNGWANDILIRTAAHDKDYKGGRNCRADINTIGEALYHLTLVNT